MTNEFLSDAEVEAMIDGYPVWDKLQRLLRDRDARTALIRDLRAEGEFYDTTLDRIALALGDADHLPEIPRYKEE